ncbi:hypothetical protein L226DRAFT_576322 [Lentinus tigrinus ALCF2SS1-7]|uniref:uncharacterized protein n=1 Tax=Lentinus tigrinus ALCF2SS1-7 TaxID=1328758 RepID=UPI001165FB42|nr:hypothetical protein L226DRAFT_576322 [Lentinus tigrinus ALCF2SS1-7]
MLNEKGFQKLPFEGTATWLLDESGIAYGFRTDLAPLMSELQADGSTFLEAIEKESLAYIKACGDRSYKDIEANNRGRHWYMVIGVDRQLSELPKLTLFHRQHLEQTRKLLEPHTATSRLIAMGKCSKFASGVLRARFPFVAQRVDRCKAKLLEMGCEWATPLFECFYNFCINGLRGEVRGVSTEPHVDGKNLALMLCVVFVWGRFAHGEKAWLVLWEAKLIIEIPPGVLLFYPSSLFIHFNVDLTDLQIVTTSDGSQPTPQNSHPLTGVEGRGSIVLFNQASMFQLAELGCTIKEAKARGILSTCDNSEHIASLPTVSTQ